MMTLVLTIVITEREVWLRRTFIVNVSLKRKFLIVLCGKIR